MLAIKALGWALLKGLGFERRMLATLKIKDYSMRVDGDFVGIYRVMVMRYGKQIEMIASVGKLAGYLWRLGDLMPFSAFAIRCTAIR